MPAEEKKRKRAPRHVYYIYDVDDGMQNIVRNVRELRYSTDSGKLRRDGHRWLISRGGHRFAFKGSDAEVMGYDIDEDLDVLKVRKGLHLESDDAYAEVIDALGLFDKKTASDYVFTRPNPISGEVINTLGFVDRYDNEDHSDYWLASSLVELLPTGQLPKSLDAKIRKALEKDLNQLEKEDMAHLKQVARRASKKY